MKCNFELMDPNPFPECGYGSGNFSDLGSMRNANLHRSTTLVFSFAKYPLLVTCRVVSRTPNTVL
jgi:hypothetical protein